MVLPTVPNQQVPNYVGSVLEGYQAGQNVRFNRLREQSILQISRMSSANIHKQIQSRRKRDGPFREM